MVRKSRKTEMPKQLTELEFVKSKIVEWEQTGKEVTMGTLQDGAFTPYENGDCLNAFLVGSIFNEDSRIILKAEIERDYKFYEEQFEKRMIAIGIW
jgi:hypothetical protein